MNKYLDKAAFEQGFGNYQNYFNWVARKGEKPVVVAQLIEAIYKKALSEWAKDMSVKNYCGDLNIEKWEIELTNLTG